MHNAAPNLLAKRPIWHGFRDVEHLLRRRVAQAVQKGHLAGGDLAHGTTRQLRGPFAAGIGAPVQHGPIDAVAAEHRRHRRASPP